MNLRSIITIVLLGIAALLHGCAVVPRPVYGHGEVMVRTTGPHHYPSYPVVVPVQPLNVSVQTEYDEHGLKGFRVTGRDLSSEQALKVAQKIDELKQQCPNGAMSKDTIDYRTKEVSPTAGRWASFTGIREDTRVNVRITCVRLREAKPPPRAGR
jgi:hypothetical protein